MDDGFDGMTRSDDAEFHQWYIDNEDPEEYDIDDYWSCETAWLVAKEKYDRANYIKELEAKVERLEKELVTQTTVLQYWYDYGYDRNQNENLLFGRTTLEVE